MNLKEICFKLKLDIKKVYNCYCYGSRVYGTSHSNSDYDYIIIMDQTEDKIDCITSDDKTVNGTLYSVIGFQKEIEKHEISVLECLFLEREHVIEEKCKFTFNLNLNQLRQSISSKSSNSWVKAKKKLIISYDYNEMVAKKSLFHSFRIIYYGIQIATCGKIVEYTEANYILKEIDKIPIMWYSWKTTFQEKRNELETKFRKLAPKIIN